MAKLVIVPLYLGLSEAEAIRLRFGDATPPSGLKTVIVANALPPDGVAYDWAEAPRDSPAFLETWAKLERAA